MRKISFAWERVSRKLVEATLPGVFCFRTLTLEKRNRLKKIRIKITKTKKRKTKQNKTKQTK